MYQRKKSSVRDLFIPILLFVCIIGGLFYGMQSITALNQDKAIENIENAVVQASVHCYAVEGMYPESLDYLKEHYGISYDEDKYVVKYEVVARNLRPQIKVISLK